MNKQQHYDDLLQQFSPVSPKQLKYNSPFYSLQPIHIDSDQKYYFNQLQIAQTPSKKLFQNQYEGHSLLQFQSEDSTKREPDIIIQKFHNTNKKLPIFINSNHIKKLDNKCNCKKSKCLKLYCDCFSRGQACKNCNCIDCGNFQQSELRYQLIMNIMSKNCYAFRAKIEESQHSLGCNCKKSNCKKRYCQCFQGGISCSDICKCIECQNTSTKSSISYQKTIKKKK